MSQWHSFIRVPCTYMRLPISYRFHLAVETSTPSWQTSVRTCLRSSCCNWSCSQRFSQLLHYILGGQKVWSHSRMVFRAMVFRPIICEISYPWGPIISELTLGLPASQPMVPHVHGFCSPGLDSVSDYPVGGAVIRLHWGWGLLMPPFLAMSIWLGVLLLH